MPPPGFYNGLTPNSTLAGDSVRLGQLAALAPAMSTPTFVLSRSVSDAIDTSTLMTWNEYYSAVCDEQHRRALAQKSARRRRIIEMYNARRQRIQNAPEELDLLLGDTPNEILVQLSNPKIHPSRLRRAGESIAGETIQRISFVHGTGESSISLGRLTVREGWPQPLRGAAFERERRVYLQPIEAALELNRRNSLTPEAYQTVRNAVAALKSKLQTVSTTLENPDYVLTKMVLDDLDEAVRPLRDPNMEKVLAGIDRYAGTTVGDLVVFMQRFHLRFAPAVTPEERESCHLLYLGMRLFRVSCGQ
jgi:hypothetical protein